MKPTVKNFNKWLKKYFDSCDLSMKYEQKDIDALEECFKIYLGNFDLKSVNSGKELQEVFMNFHQPILELAKYNKDLCAKNDQTVFEYRRRITGYRFNTIDGRCSSSNKELKDYSFSIWHCYWNNQIMVDKVGHRSFIRIMWKDLFKAMYDFFDETKPYPSTRFIQTSLF